MNIGIVVITDGRQAYMEQAIASASEHLKGVVPHWGIVVDDSGDIDHQLWVEHHFPGWWCHSHGVRRGLGAAVGTAWSSAMEDPTLDFLFHLEEDFIFDGDVDVQAMADVLATNPRLAQLVLKRQPWSPEEHSAGGQIELGEEQGDKFEERTDGEHTWVEHQRLFSYNPCLIPRRTLELIRGGGLEADVTRVLLSKRMSFAYWGGKKDAPLCEHIGHQRSAEWRL